MEGQLVIHGKPTEGEFLSVDMFDGLEERIYTDFFGASTKPTESPCFVFGIRKWKGTLYSVYSYYINGKDYYGSDNGYCVISLIIRGYHTKEYGKMMSALHLVYDTKLKKELKIKDASDKYLVRTLKDNIDRAILDSKCKDIISDFRWEDIKTPSDSTSMASDTSCCLSAVDADDSRVNDFIKRDGKIYISTKFTSISEKIEIEKQKENERIQSIIKKQEERKPNIKLNDDPDNPEPMRNSGVKTVVFKRKKNKVKDTISDDKLKNSQDSISNDAAKSSSNNFPSTKFSNWISLVNCFILLIILFFPNRCNNPHDSGGDVEPKKYPLVDTNLYDPETDSDITKTEPDNINNQYNEDLISAMNEILRIDIDAVNNGRMSINTPGTLSVRFLKGASCSLPGQFYIIEGSGVAEIYDNNTIYTNNSGTVKIGYEVYGVTILEREITIE